MKPSYPMSESVAVLLLCTGNFYILDGISLSLASLSQPPTWMSPWMSYETKGQERVFPSCKLASNARLEDTADNGLSEGLDSEAFALSSRDGPCGDAAGELDAKGVGI